MPGGRDRALDGGGPWAPDSDAPPDYSLVRRHPGQLELRRRVARMWRRTTASPALPPCRGQSNRTEMRLSIRARTVPPSVHLLPRRSIRPAINRPRIGRGGTFSCCMHGRRGLPTQRTNAATTSYCCRFQLMRSGRHPFLSLGRSSSCTGGRSHRH